MVLGIIVLALLVGGCSTYNGMVTLDEGVDQSWANVQSAYQRRHPDNHRLRNQR